MRWVVVTAVLALLATSCARPQLATVDLDARNDSLLLRDTANGFDWLRLSATTGLSVDQVLGGAGGWVERGFRYATTVEVCALLAVYGQALAPCPGRMAGGEADAADTLVAAIGPSLETRSAVGATGFFASSGGMGLASVVRSDRTVTVSVHEGPESMSNGRPDVGHFLVRRHITVYGRPGRFGNAPTQLPSGVPVAYVGVDGFAVDPGQSLYHPAVASDGTLFMANVTQAYNQLVPLACRQSVTCFNPDAATCRDTDTGRPAHFANLRVPSNLDRAGTLAPDVDDCRDLEPGEAGGADISDLLVVGSGQDQRLLASSLLGSIAPMVAPAELHPAWCSFRKTHAGWDVDPSETYFASELRDLSPPASETICRPKTELLCSDDRSCPVRGGCDYSEPVTLMGKQFGRCSIACEASADCPVGLTCGPGGTCALTDCGGLNELALLPRSGHVVATLYTRHGLAVLDQEGRALASFEHGLQLANPCLCEDPDAPATIVVPARAVEVDPTSELGDERFAVVYDSVSCGLGQLVQEFRYRAPTPYAPAQIEAVTPLFVPEAPSYPRTSCAGRWRGRAVLYDGTGNLWVQTGSPFTIDPLAVFLRNPTTGRRSLEERCGVLDRDTGELRPPGTRCPADLDLGAPRSPKLAAFGAAWSPHLFEHAASRTVFSLGIRAALGATRRMETLSGAVVFASTAPLDVGAAQLPRPPTTRMWAWKAAFHPELREFFVPIGLQSLDLEGGAVFDNWVYRIGVDTVLEARPRLLAAEAPARARDDEEIPVSLTVDLTGVPTGIAHALYVTADQTLVRAAEWKRRCAPGGRSCTFDATIPPGVGARPDGALAWHALLHTTTGSLHVAGRVELLAP